MNSSVIILTQVADSPISIPFNGISQLDTPASQGNKSYFPWHVYPVYDLKKTSLTRLPDMKYNFP